MVTELLRKGHHGPIVSAVSVRQWADLGYLDQHRRLEQRFANYQAIATMGTESMFASASGVTRLVAPGPEVAMQTPTLPVADA